ncbi:hypothetical protein ABK040_008043 [Willaertia magna]
MTKSKICIKIRKLVFNTLLDRKQLVIDILHPNQQNLSKKELKEKISIIYKVSDLETIFLSNCKSNFGGGKSTVFCKIYNNISNAMKMEPYFRLKRNKVKQLTIKRKAPRQHRKHIRKWCNGKMRGEKKMERKNHFLRTLSV